MPKSDAKLDREIAKFLVESEIENASGPTGMWKVTDRVPTLDEATKIAAWRRAGGGNSRVRSHMTKDNPEARCTTCGRAAGDPYRRRVGGKTVEGCIDDAHTGHLYGDSLRWHMRPEAKSYRVAMKLKRRELLKPMSRSRSHMNKPSIEQAARKLNEAARRHVAAGKGPESAARAAIRETQDLFPSDWKLGVQGDDDEDEVEIWEVDHKYGSPLGAVRRAVPKPIAPKIGDRFDYIGRVFEVVKIGRDKKKTLQLARRTRDSFGKEILIDHRSLPTGDLENLYYRPIGR